MKINQLMINEVVGRMFDIVVTHADLTETTANTAQTIALVSVKAGEVWEVLGTHVKTAFKDASDTAFNTTAIEIGDGSDTDRLLASQELNVNGTEVLNKAGVGPYAFNADDTIDLTVGSMSAKSLSNIDTGELHIFLRVFDMTAGI